MSFAVTRMAAERLVRPPPALGASWWNDASTSNSYVNVTSVTSSGSLNTKGSWVTIDASTAVNAAGFTISPQGATGVSGQQKTIFLDIALGPSGAPTILIENLMIPPSIDHNYWIPIQIPLRVAIGTELIMRAQSESASHAVSWVVTLLEDRGNTPTYSNVITMGENTSTTHGVVMTTPAGTNTKGAWTEIEASTSTYIRALSWGFSFEWQPGWSSLQFLFDIAYGDSGTETLLFENLATRTASSETTYEHLPYLTAPVAVNLPAGSRLAGRWQGSGIQQDMDLVLYGWS